MWLRAKINLQDLKEYLIQVLGFVTEKRFVWVEWLDVFHYCPAQLVSGFTEVLCVTWLTYPSISVCSLTTHDSFSMWHHSNSVRACACMYLYSCAVQPLTGHEHCVDIFCCEDILLHHNKSRLSLCIGVRCELYFGYRVRECVSVRHKINRS